MKSRSTSQILDLILEVAKADSRILAVLQDGSRSNPNVTPDIFQDFDIIYVVEDAIGSVVLDDEVIAKGTREVTRCIGGEISFGLSPRACEE